MQDLEAPPADHWPEVVGMAQSAGALTVIHIDDAPWQMNVRSPEHVLSVTLGPRVCHIAFDDNRMVQRHIPAGGITFIPQGTTLKSRTGSVDAELIAVSVPDGAMRALLDENGVPESALIGDTSARPETSLETVRALRSLLMAQGTEALETESVAAGLVLVMVADWGRGKASSRARQVLTSRTLRRVLEYVESDPSQPHRLEGLAAQASLSPWHFARAFREATGVPPHAFVLEKRLARARRWLLGSDMPISEIAYAVGFSSQAHLTNRMKKHFGQTPGAIRRAHRCSVAMRSNRKIV